MSLDLSSSFHQFRIPMADKSRNGVLAFDQFRIDVEKLMLYRDDAEGLIPAKVAKTLAVLVESAGTILSKDELIERVWDDSIVEESNLTQYLYLLRKTLGTMPDGRPYIETLRRRGYRFNGAVHREERADSHIPKTAKPAVAAAAAAQATHGAVEREGNVLRVVDWKPTEIQPTVVEPAAPVVSKRRFPNVAIALLVVLALGGVTIAYFWPRLMASSINAEDRRELSVVRLTNGSFATGATISPDGNYFVYNEVSGETVRMYLQQVGQPSRTEIASFKDKAVYAKTFSPDGKFIYFHALTFGERLTWLYRIPTMGGSEPTRLLHHVSGPISFSPDGKEFVFVRLDDVTGRSSLIVADRDGRTERVILERRKPQLIWPSPIWSPDGNDIVFLLEDRDPRLNPLTRKLHILKVATGEVKPLSDENWDNVLRAVWTPDGSGIVMLATRWRDGYSMRRDQVYYVSYPQGISRRITTEGNRHETDSLGITKDGTILVVSGNRSSQIWALGGDGDSAKAVQLTRGSADGRAGLGPLPDGRIGFIARTAEDIILLIANADGSDAKQLPIGFPMCEELRADPNGNFFVFSAFVDGKSHLYRVNSDGSDVKQLTFGESTEIDSSISKDGKSIVYQSVTLDNGLEKNSIMKISSEGGTPQFLADQCTVPTYSPDGSLVSCVGTDKYQIVILSSADGSRVETHPLPVFAVSNFGIGWTPDSTGLIYIMSEKEVFNLWIQPRDGSKGRNLTNFSSGVIYRYAYTPDFSRIFVARGYPIQDVVLIKNYR